MMLLHEKTIELLEKLNQHFENLSKKLLDMVSRPLEEELLDNTDLKHILKIGDTKFFQLKKSKLFPTYRLNGKDYYLEKEILEAIRINKSS